MDKSQTYLECIKIAASVPGMASTNFGVIITRADKIFARLAEITQNSDKPPETNK